MRLLPTCLAAALLAGGAAEARTPPLSLEPCAVPRVSEPLRCGRLTVPEDRTKPGGRTLDLKVVVVPATGPRTHPPLYDLAGGPGLAASDGADFWAGHPLRAGRDIVLVDQRGTGGSQPLACELDFSNPFAPLLDPRAVAACRDRLAAGHDLAQYSTAAAAADLDAVRAALGQDRIDVVGLSYGTRLALEYLRAYPSRVRAMVLIGTVHPADRLPLGYSRDAQAVLDALGRQCAADAACRAAIPDLAADVARLRSAFAAGAVEARLADGAPVRLEAGPFWEAVRAQLATTSGQRRLPWLLHEAAAGRHAPILAAMAPRPGPDGFSNGLLLSVVCPEDTLRIDEAEIAPAEATAFGAHRLRAQLAACRAWGTPARHGVRPGPVRSDVPALLLAGEMDHVTPPAGAVDVAAALPNGRVVRIPFLAHVPGDGLSGFECYDGLIGEFLARGRAQELDTSCVAQMKPVPFAGSTP